MNNQKDLNSNNNQLIKFDHMNISVESFEKTVDWYRKAFDFRLVEEGYSDENLHWGIIKKDDIMLCFTERPNYAKTKDSGF